MSGVLTLPSSAWGQSANPFEEGLKAIAASRIVAPEQYRYRLGVQLALCALLMLVSLIFLVANAIDGKRRDKTMWLIKIQRPKNLIVVNSLPCFSTMALLAGVGLFYSRYHVWRAYIEMRDARYTTIISFVPWLIILSQAWAFSFTNLLATLAARRSLGIAAAQKLSITSPWLNNLIFVGFPLSIVIVCTVTAALSSACSNQILVTVNTLVPLLQSASAALMTNQPLELSLLAKLQQKQLEVQRLSHQAVVYIYALTAVAAFVCVTLIAMNAYALVLVLLLRRQAKSNRMRREAHGSVPSHTEVAVISSLSATPSPMRTPRFSGLAPNRPTPLVGHSQNEKAMDRLAADLSFAVPVTIMMVLVLLSGLGLLCAKISKQLVWTDVELSTDLFSWVYLVFTNATVIFFIFNLWRHWTRKTSKEEVKSPDMAERPPQLSPILPQQFVVTLGDHGEAELDKAKDNSSTELASIASPV